MRDAKICAENLRTLIERTGKTRHQVAEEAGVEYKALCRWMKHGAEHESEGLRKLCGWLRIEPNALWEPLPQNESQMWGEHLTKLLRFVRRYDGSVMNDVLTEINRSWLIAKAVKQVVTEHPDWTPAEFQFPSSRSQFWKVWQVASRWHYESTDQYLDRLLAQIGHEKLGEAEKNAIQEEVAKQLAERTAELRKDIQRAAELDALMRQSVEPEPSPDIPDPDRFPRRRRRRR